MLANWGGARVARGHHLDEMPPVGMARPRLGLDGLAGERIGHVDRPIRSVGDAVAAMTEMGDRELFDHRTAGEEVAGRWPRSVRNLNRATSSDA